MAVEYRVETFTGTTGDLVNLLNDTWSPQGYRLHTIVSRVPSNDGGLERERR